MQPPHLLLASISATPLLLMGLWAGLPSQANTEHSPEDGSALFAAPPTPNNRIWVRVVDPITLTGLASAFNSPPRDLSRLNSVNLAHRFEPGDWVVMDAAGADRVVEVMALDSAQIRRTPPAKQVLGATRALNPGAAVGALIGVQQPPDAKAVGRASTTRAIKPTTSEEISLPRRQAPMQGAWIWPTKGAFTSGYGWRWGRMHKGIDIANNVGTPIVAAQNGVVNFAGWSSGYGYLIELRHPNGTLTRYAHNSKMLVRKGQVVAQGQRISLMGSTGRSTGPHLHFEVLPPGRGAINPLKMLPLRA